MKILITRDNEDYKGTGWVPVDFSAFLGSIMPTIAELNYKAKDSLPTFQIFV